MNLGDFICFCFTDRFFLERDRPFKTSGIPCLQLFGSSFPPDLDFQLQQAAVGVAAAGCRHGRVVPDSG
jgi:hypothetical protein